MLESVRRTALALAALGALLTSGALLTGCNRDPACGPGTVEKGGACVADPKAMTCGAGTQLDGGVCVATADAGGGATLDVSGSDMAPTDVADTAPTDAVDAAQDATACVPFCLGKPCGPDGCGGSCGTCKAAEAPYCNNSTGQCAAVCVPDCVDKDCGTDGCGGQCGTCAATLTCQEFGRCVPDAWTCDAKGYGADAVCDCGCGAADPDCGKAGVALGGCAPFQGCDAAGKCVSKIPSGWTCAPGSYGAQDACDCGCGAADPDCALEPLPVLGCKGAAKCDAKGACLACAPDCKDKVCGDDGCGGLCGTCSAPTSACEGGKCVDPCKPTPLLCKANPCGDDGCGGTCGTCKSGEACTAGKCVGLPPVDDPTSCKGHCSGTAPAGCSCMPSCKTFDTCCKDYDALCLCTPDCTGKECGSNGCGGGCGACPDAKPACGADGKCTDKCTPQCKGATCGPDGCGGTCGACATGSTCAWTQQCVPSTWQCDPGYYADKIGCDCGCGAPDPDCKTAGTTVYGCPAKVACGESGVCSTAKCLANAECKNQWCVGKLFQGGAKFAGTCANPLPTASAPGQPCQFDLQCATELCVGGLCRQYCKQDADCPPYQACLGLATSSSAGAQGFAGVCAAIAGSLSPCKAQADCKPNAEQCVAYTDPATLGPKYLCSALNQVAFGASCANKACPAGHLCIAAKLKYQCTLPCPAGDVDCPDGWQCGSATLHNAGTADPADDPKVPACVPK